MGLLYSRKTCICKTQIWSSLKKKKRGGGFRGGTFLRPLGSTLNVGPIIRVSTRNHCNLLKTTFLLLGLNRMYCAYLREITFQTHTWCTGIFISHSIRDTVVCGKPTRYTAMETTAGWLRGRCAGGVSIIVKIIRGSERCRLPLVKGAFLRKKTETELFVKQMKKEKRNQSVG